MTDDSNIKEVIECLRWYVYHDETQDTPYNTPWLEGKNRAINILQAIDGGE